MKPSRNWIPDDLFKTISGMLPIPCVDVMPVKRAKAGTQVGLIYRETPHQGRRWCLIGGRLRLNETLREAVRREIRSALGAGVRLDGTFGQPFAVEYFSVRKGKALFDPRKHAISWTFPVEIRGKIRPANEALDFRWFGFSDLRAEKSIGFGQKEMLLRWAQEA